MKGVLTHHPQCCTAWKIQNGHQRAPKWLTGSGKVSTPRFWGILSNFRKNKFFDPSTSSMRKGRDGEKKRGKKNGKKKKKRKDGSWAKLSSSWDWA